MKKYIILACLALGVITSSCVDINIYAGKNPVDAGIDKDNGYYTSWIVIQNGNERQKYQTTLNYPVSQHDILTQKLVSHIKADGFTVSEEKIDSTTIGSITHYTKKVYYNFQFSEFVVPVSYTEEYAVWSNPESGERYQMPSVKIENIETEMNFEQIRYETIDDKVYETYLLTYTVTDNHYIMSTSKIKLWVETFLTIDDTLNEIVHDVFI